MKRPKHSCINCHFLYYYTRLEDGKSNETTISNETRNQIINGNTLLLQHNNYNFECYKKVWTESHFVNGLAKKKEVILYTERTDYCFFFPYHQEMLMQAAEILQERKWKLRESHKDRKYMRIGLYIAGGALVVNVFLQLIQFISDGF